MYLQKKRHRRLKQKARSKGLFLKSLFTQLGMICPIGTYLQDLSELYLSGFAAANIRVLHHLKG